jgi:hypothetical protein
MTVSRHSHPATLLNDGTIYGPDLGLEHRRHCRGLMEESAKAPAVAEQLYSSDN